MNRLVKPKHMGSYRKEDVTFLLKEIGSEIAETDSEAREKLIQSGVHYSELLPQEYEPSEAYMKMYKDTLNVLADKTAQLTAITANKIVKYIGKGAVLVSLARAGTPVGVLLKRYMDARFGIDVPHYSISIIRGKGFDINAMKYITQNHSEQDIIFVDGWTGKGAIGKQLDEACAEFNTYMGTSIKSVLAVLADPAQSAQIYGTREDFLLPSACLNSTVSGLVSRTFHRDDVIGADDYHGARFYKDLLDADVSNDFIDTVCASMTVRDWDNLGDGDVFDSAPPRTGIKTTLRIGHDYGIQDVNHIKPGIGETTRVLLRRVPWKILINPTMTTDLTHILQLAKDRGVEVEEYYDMEYSCCGLIKVVV